jgi:hypothetical protein
MESYAVAVFALASWAASCRMVKREVVMMRLGMGRVLSFETAH